MAGNMTVGKERMKRRLVQGAAQSKKFRRFAVLGGLAILGLIGLIVVPLLDDERRQSTQIFSHVQLEYFEQLERMATIRLEEAPNMEDVYAHYEQQLASYYFAQSLNLESSKEELQAEKKLRYKELTAMQNVPQYQQLFANKDVNQYVDTYIQPMLPMFVAKKKLQALYKEKYPNFPDTLVRQIAEQEAIRYFNAHFAEQARDFQEEIGLMYYSNRPNAPAYVGTVVAVKDNTFLFVEGAVPEDLQHFSQEDIMERYQNATWYPLESIPITLKQGDYVEVKSTSFASENAASIERYGLLHDVAIVNPSVMLQPPFENITAIAQYLQQLIWEQDQVQDMGPPDYYFMLNDMRVDVWLLPASAMQLYTLEYGTVKLGHIRTEKLKTWLHFEN